MSVNLNKANAAELNQLEEGDSISFLESDGLVSNDVIYDQWLEDNGGRLAIETLYSDQVIYFNL